MRALVRPLVLAVALTLACGAASLSAQRQRAPQKPSDPLIGTWTLNLEKSKYPGTPPKSVRRTFDFTLDGMILVTVETVNAQGNTSFLHWFMSPDGKEHPEFGRPGKEPTYWLSTKVVDANTKDVHDRRVVAAGQREQIILYNFAVAPDGKTLTLTSKTTNAEGKETVTVAVFDKQY